jgi:hypothetical protein
MLMTMRWIPFSTITSSTTNHGSLFFNVVDTDNNEKQCKLNICPEDLCQRCNLRKCNMGYTLEFKACLECCKASLKPCKYFFHINAKVDARKRMSVPPDFTIFSGILRRIQSAINKNRSIYILFGTGSSTVSYIR